MSSANLDLDAKTVRKVHNQLVDPLTRKLDRRRFLTLSAMLGAAFAVPGLAGCGTAGTREAAAPAAAPKPEGEAVARAIGAAAAGNLSWSPPLTNPFEIPPSKGKKLRIGVHFQPILTFWQRYQASLLLRLEELGEQAVYEWTQPDFGSSIAGLERVLQQGVDAMVIGGMNKETIVPFLPELKKRNVPAVGMQNDTPGLPVVLQNSFWLATISMMYLIERLGGKGNIAIYNTIGLSFAGDHMQPVMDAMLKFFPDIKVVATVPAKFPDPEKSALEDTENLLRRFGKKDLNALWVLFDALGIGAGRAIKDAGRQNDIFMVSTGGEDASIEAMANGDPVWGFVGWVDYWDIGRRTADMAVTVARGGTVPMLSAAYGAGITKANAPAFKKLIDEQNKLTEETLKRYGKKS